MSYRFSLFVCVSALSACGADTLGPGGLGPLSVSIDDSVQPIRTTTQDGRPLTAVEGANGRGASFVADEILLTTREPELLTAVLERFAGEVLHTTAPVDPAVSDTYYYRVRVTPEAVDPETLAARIAERNPNMRGELRAADARALELLWAASEVKSEGVMVSANWMLSPAAINERSTTEAPSSSDETYSPNAFTWPAFNRGSAQDFGVAESWRLLEAAGRTNNRVKIAILDGGFMQSPDLPASTSIHPEGRWSTPNPSTCSGGNPCPWHGTGVATAAMGVADNGFGSAGPGGTIGDAVLIQSPDYDIGGMFEYVFETLPGAFFAGPRVLNMSFSGSIPAAACVLACGALDGLTSTVRDLGILAIASAGNDGADVDEEDCFLGACWEQEAIVPCELDDVICVGGLGWDSQEKAGGSNYGSNPSEDTSVDIFSPYTVYVGPNPDDGGAAENIAKRGSGTSYSAPFVAGVAAMVWAAQPALSVDGVEAVLRDTAHPGGVENVPRRVDAYAAVVQALGGDAPPFVHINGPFDGAEVASVSAAVTFRANANDDAGPVTIAWTSDLAGPLGEGFSLTRSGLRAGTHAIQATATDNAGWTVHDTITVEVLNTAPEVAIVQPPPGATFYQGQTIHLAAQSYDLDLDDRLPEDGVTWSLDGSPTALGHLTSLPAGSLSLGSHTLHAEANDGEDGDQKTITLFIAADPVDLPPSAVITAPVSGGLGPVQAADAGGWYRMATLSAQAFDPEDGPLSDESLQWEVARGAQAFTPAGEGEAVTVKLYAPQCGDNLYRLRVTAIDSQGGESVFQIQVFVTRGC